MRLALFCSIFRKCVFLAGLLLLPALVSPEATFLSEPIADAVAATVTTCLFLHFFPKILAQRAAREREEREEQSCAIIGGGNRPNRLKWGHLERSV